MGLTGANEVMVSTPPGLTSERDSAVYSQALCLLRGFEVLLQTSVFTLLMILHVQPLVAIVICAILFIACRLASRVCTSRLKQLTMR